MLLLTRHSATLRATQKPQQWGPASVVASAVRSNANRVLRIPAPVSWTPILEEVGPPLDVVTGKRWVDAGARTEDWHIGKWGYGQRNQDVVNDGYRGLDVSSLVTPGRGSLFCAFRKNVYEAFKYHDAFGSANYSNNRWSIGVRDQSSSHVLSGYFGGTSVLFSGVSFPSMSDGAAVITSNTDGSCAAYCDGKSATSTWDTANWTENTEFGLLGYWLTSASQDLYSRINGTVYAAGVWAEELTAEQAHRLNEQWVLLSQPPYTFAPFVFDLGAGGTAIGDTLSLPWQVHTTAGDDLAALWQVLGAAGDTVVAPWQIYAAAGASAVLPWQVLAALGDTVTLDWSIAAPGAVGATIELRWSVLAAVAEQLEARWDVLAALGVERTALWQITRAVTDQLEAQWSTLEAVGDTATLSWDLVGVVAGQVVLRWTVQSDTWRASAYVVTVPAEDRTVTVPAEARTVTVQ